MRQFITRNKSNYIALLSFFFLIMLFFQDNVNGCKNKKNDLCLLIKIKNKKIIRNKPIELSLTFKSNINGKFKIYKHPSFGLAVAMGPKDWLSFNIISPTGKAIDKYSPGITGLPKRPFKGDFVEVGAEKYFTEIMKIYPYERFDEIKRPWTEKGIYKIQAIYSYKHNKFWTGGKELWEGTVTSNWVSVKVE